MTSFFVMNAAILMVAAQLGHLALERMGDVYSDPRTPQEIKARLLRLFVAWDE